MEIHTYLCTPCQNFLHNLSHEIYKDIPDTGRKLNMPLPNIFPYSACPTS